MIAGGLVLFRYGHGAFTITGWGFFILWILAGTVGPVTGRRLR